MAQRDVKLKDLDNIIKPASRSGANRDSDLTNFN